MEPTSLRFSQIFYPDFLTVLYMQMVIPTRDPRHRFHCLKHLQLKMIMLSKKYNNLCLVSFLDAAPFLESLIVHVSFSTSVALVFGGVTE